MHGVKDRRTIRRVRTSSVVAQNDIAQEGGPPPLRDRVERANVRVSSGEHRCRVHLFLGRGAPRAAPCAMCRARDAAAAAAFGRSDCGRDSTSCELCGRTPGNEQTHQP